MYKTVTISREFGSGGRELGRCLAEKSNFAYYDHEIIAEIAKRTLLAEDYVQHIIESKPACSIPIHVGVTFTTISNRINGQKGVVFREQCNLLKELSEKSDCVIVGRSADYILSDYKPYHIFIYSDIESCMVRCRLKGNQDNVIYPKKN
ncbi:AAA family ATPase [Clostridium sp. FAM 1755]|uniref:cytidylate kinase-like family protein n=1 Tax=Clostridium caseinilyticum TaxID=3350403 RepID=UPI0038F638AA